MGDIKIKIYHSGRGQLRMHFYRETDIPHETEEVFHANLTCDEATALGTSLLDYAAAGAQMKLTPEEQRKMADELRKRAELETDPDEKQEILNKASQFEMLEQVPRNPKK